MDRVDCDLHRFVSAQQADYTLALSELERGRKEGHWMWYIFPQIAGLGQSATARHYAIESSEEARAYLAHPLLGERLLECCRALTGLDAGSAEWVLGTVDALKLRSSMTLFMSVSPEPLFQQVLDKFYRGEKDLLTVSLLEKQSAGINPS